MKWLVYIVLLMLLASVLKAGFGSDKKRPGDDDREDDSDD